MRQIRVRAAALLAVSALAVGGCGFVGGAVDDRPSDDTDFAQPTEEAPEDLGPITEPPRDTRQVRGQGFALHAPSEFQQSDREGPGGIPMIVLGKSSNRSGGVVEVVVFAEQDPPAGAEEQMYGLAGQKEISGATDIVRQAVEWPDATTAVLVRWTERTSTAQGEITQRFAQLALQREGGDIVTAIAVAPEEEFDDSGALEVLRTLTLEGA
jgi:hypothetical protein